MKDSEENIGKILLLSIIIIVVMFLTSCGAYQTIMPKQGQVYNGIMFLEETERGSGHRRFGNFKCHCGLNFNTWINTKRNSGEVRCFNSNNILYQD